MNKISRFDSTALTDICHSPRSCLWLQTRSRQEKHGNASLHKCHKGCDTGASCSELSLGTYVATQSQSSKLERFVVDFSLKWQIMNDGLLMPVDAFKPPINIKRCKVVLLPIRCLWGASVSEFDSNSNVLEEGMNNELLNKARPTIGFIMNDIDLKYCKLLLFSKDCSCTTIEKFQI